MATRIPTTTRTEPLSAAVIGPKLAEVVKRHGGIHHHAQKVAAEFYAAARPKIEPGAAPVSK